MRDVLSVLKPAFSLKGSHGTTEREFQLPALFRQLHHGLLALRGRPQQD